jgi:hypothetical protein
MSELMLSGLRATEPIGFLAALGLLRICDKTQLLGSVKLGWADDAEWSAVLATESECDADRLVAMLLDHMKGRSTAPAFQALPEGAGGDDSGNGPALQEWNDVKVPLDDYRNRLVAVRQTTDRGHRESADYLSALGSEFIAGSDKETVKPSALHTTAGRQAFLERIRDVARSLDPSAKAHPKAACPPDEAFREAVFNRRSEGLPGWRAEDQLTSFGYDPAREAVYALVAAAPTDTGARSTRAAVWLALESLPLFPSLPSGLKLHTRGFNLRATTFRWPVWNGFLSSNAVRTLVGGRELWGSKPRSQATRKADRGESSDSTMVQGPALRRLGIRAVMESARVIVAQGYGQLRPAVRVQESES